MHSMVSALTWSSLLSPLSSHQTAAKYVPIHDAVPLTADADRYHALPVPGDNEVDNHPPHIPTPGDKALSGADRYAPIPIPDDGVTADMNEADRCAPITITQGQSPLLRSRRQ